jgi:hypothetical protein
VSKIMEGDSGQARVLQERSEGPLPEVARVDEVPDFSGEDEALILTGLQLFSAWCPRWAEATALIA